MSVNPGAMSPSQLKGLKAGERISIRYAQSQQEIEDGASRIIVDQFPKRVATAFSTTWAALFPSIQKIGLTDLSRPKRTSVSIVGGSPETVRSILTWILSCCDGHGMQPFPHSAIKPFTEYYIVKVSAENMGVHVLSREMSRRLNQLASGQIHSEDIRAMYLRMPEDHEILQDLARHVADLISERKLRAFNVYRTVRDEIPQFDYYVNAFLEEKEATQISEQDKQTREKKTKYHDYDPRQRQLQRGFRDAAGMNTVKNRNKTTALATNAPSKNDKIPREDVLTHTTIHCTVARKAKKGRPAYVNLPLAAVGVTENAFIGNTITSLRPVKSGPRSNNKETNRATTPKPGKVLAEVDDSRAEVEAVAEPAVSSITRESPAICAEGETAQAALSANAKDRTGSVFSPHGPTLGSLEPVSELMSTAVSTDSTMSLPESMSRAR